MSVAQERQARVRERVRDRACDVLVVTHLPSVEYLTGYRGSNAIAVVGADGITLITDGRYATSARAQVGDDAEVVIGTRDLIKDTVAAIVAHSPADATVGVEAAHMTLATADTLREALAGEGRTLSGQTGIVEEVRAVKSAAEIAAIRASAALTDRALARVLAEGIVGRTEREVAWRIQEALNAEGATRPSFDVIVAAGPNGALPHAVPSDDVIPTDTLCVIDLGAVYQGYCSDMTRTSVLGEPPADLREIYAVCAEAHAAAVAAVRPGIACADLDAVAREVITQAGYGPQFGHGLGHGVGIEIHEAPRVGTAAAGTLASGMVVTIEPGIYVEGRGGVRIEDLVVVTDDGHEVLSHAPKDATTKETNAHD